MHLLSDPPLIKFSYLVALVVHPGTEFLAFLFSTADLVVFTGLKALQVMIVMVRDACIAELVTCTVTIFTL